MMRESVIESKCANWVRENDGFLLKNKPVRIGWPDRILLTPCGRVAFIEFKVPGKKPTARQVHELQWLNAHGHIGIWLTSAVAFKEFYVDLLRGTIAVEGMTRGYHRP